MEIKVPDIGDFTDIPVLSILVNVGDTVSVEDPLIEFESDKATMEVPSPADGVITAISVAEGDLVSEGSLIMKLESQSETGTAAAAPAPDEHSSQASSSQVSAPAPAMPSDVAGTGDLHAEVLVLGSGPGGYTAAFRAADLGLKAVLAGYGLYRLHRWAVSLSLSIAVTTVAVLLFFLWHVTGGKPYEMRTVVAMLLRSGVWIFVAVFACRNLACRPGPTVLT